MTHPKDTPATSGSADQAVREAVEYLRACEKTNPFITRHTKSLDLVLHYAEQAAELRERVDKLSLFQIEWNKERASINKTNDAYLIENKRVEKENQSLRQRIKALEAAVEIGKQWVKFKIDDGSASAEGDMRCIEKILSGEVV